MKNPIVYLAGALTLVGALIAAGSVQIGAAQTVGTTPTVQGTTTPTGPTNALQANFFACPDSVTMNLSGYLVSGFSAYYQVFAGGTNAAITNIRRVDQTETFTFAERIALPAGQTLTEGANVGARVWVGDSSNATIVDFEFAVSDIQDSCGTNSLVGTVGTSTDTGVGGGTVLGGTGSTAGVVETIVPGSVGVSRSIRAPQGYGDGFLNPNLSGPEAEVIVGVRPSDVFRSTTPGLIYAECDEYGLALPGTVYDSDNVVVFWSWYTRTRAQMEDHLAKAQYNVRMNTAALQPVNRSEIERRGANFWVFYTAQIGNLRTGHYEVDYQLTWSGQHDDGYKVFGPGADEREAGNCNFDVTRNPNGQSVIPTNMFFPSLFPVHDITPDD